MAKNYEAKIKSKHNNGRIFVYVPKIVYDNTDLNYTDKIILSLINGYKATWNDVGTDTIAGYVGRSRKTVNRSIQKLVFLELIEEQYVGGRKRSFRSLLPKPQRYDRYATITDSILADDTIDNTYKLTAGVIISASLGDNNDLEGFNFKQEGESGVKVLASRLNLSVSSVYRHLSVLFKKKVVSRNYGSSFVQVSDPYLRNHANNVRKQKMHEENLTLANNPPDVKLSPEEHKILDSIYNEF